MSQTITNQLLQFKGETFSSIKVNDDKTVVTFKFKEDSERVIKMFHYQDCCECVSLIDVIGDLEDLENSKMLMAEEVVSNEDPTGITDKEGLSDKYGNESFTWTFYKFATIKGYVTLRWLGTSNGYYSEGVSCMIFNNEKEAKDEIRY